MKLFLFKIAEMLSHGQYYCTFVHYYIILSIIRNIHTEINNMIIYAYLLIKEVLIYEMISKSNLIRH